MVRRDEEAEDIYTKPARDQADTSKAKQMRLRYLQTYNGNGVTSEAVLQYWDEEEEMWKDVNTIRVSEVVEFQVNLDQERY